MPGPRSTSLLLTVVSSPSISSVMVPRPSLMLVRMSSLILSPSGLCAGAMSTLIFCLA